jgi:hypothetical protein
MAGLVREMRGLKKSSWSGYAALVGRVERDWQDTKYILSFFGKGNEGRRGYLKYVSEGIEPVRNPLLLINQL